MYTKYTNRSVESTLIAHLIKNKEEEEEEEVSFLMENVYVYLRVY